MTETRTTRDIKLTAWKSEWKFSFYVESQEREDYLIWELKKLVFWEENVKKIIESIWKMELTDSEFALMMFDLWRNLG